MKLRTVRQIKDVKNKKVLVRVDFNCPIEKGRVVDDSRITFSMPTIEYLIHKGAKVILISHLGRPLKNKINVLRIKNKYSLEPVFHRLKKILHQKFKRQNIQFVHDCAGAKVKNVIDRMKAGEVILLENLRFYAQEMENDKTFAKQLADLADIYVNDAFSVSHREHASVSAITTYMPSYAGLLLEREVNTLSSVLENPSHPFVLIMGGVKISTKINPIKNLLALADFILVGGALANNFLKAKGVPIGKSFYEPKMISFTKTVLKNKKIILPCDVRIESASRDPVFRINELNNVGNNFEIFDIGPKTIALFSQYIKTAKMIVWNGPLGYFEDERFSQGTRKITQAIIKNKKAHIIIGGGETISALKKYTDYNVGCRNIFISSGGGAMLAFLSNTSLPGIEPLRLEIGYSENR